MPPAPNVAYYSCKLVNGTKKEAFICTHYQVTYLDDGIIIELCSPANTIIRIPKDGELFVENGTTGTTIDAYRWPPKGR